MLRDAALRAAPQHEGEREGIAKWRAMPDDEHHFYAMALAEICAGRPHARG